MSIELYEKIRALEERVAALEALLHLLRQGADNLALSSIPPRKKPGPKPGFKRQLPAQ